jgi:phospholipid/cholesterol/gamma-HCH transport system substrate-binding protein
MGRNLIETIMGAVVLLVAGFFLVFAYSHADLKQVQGNTVSAQFVSVGGLEKGSDVRINGIKIGTVANLAIDPQSFNAVVTMTIRPDIKLPADTVASVSTEGLLGGKFVRLVPGRSKEVLADGQTLAHTKEHKSIEEMVGQLIFLATADNPTSAPAAGQPK